MNRELDKLEWYRKGYELYNPSYDTIAKIKKRISVYLIEVVIDLECKDVHYLIPKLFKTLYMCEVNHCATYSVNFKNLPAIINSKTIINKKPDTQTLYSVFLSKIIQPHYLLEHNSNIYLPSIKRIKNILKMVNHWGRMIIDCLSG